MQTLISSPGAILVVATCEGCAMQISPIGCFKQTAYAIVVPN